MISKLIDLKKKRISKIIGHFPEIIGEYPLKLFFQNDWEWKKESECIISVIFSLNFQLSFSIKIEF